MSNAWINIRFGMTHIIIGERSLFSVRVSKNEHHRDNKKRIELHELKLFGYRFK